MGVAAVDQPYDVSGDMSLFQSNLVLDPITAQPVRIFDYEIIEKIGEGAGSTIYAVTHPETKQIYALKHCIRKVEKDIRFIEQLENEFTIGKNLTHPNLRKLIDYKEGRSMLFKVTDAALVMELFDGTPLEQHIPPALPALMQVAINTAQAIEAMHKTNVVHCDLKPNNIMLGANGTVKVIDLGQACPVGTKKTRIQGTPDYISPEQVKCQPVSPRTDIFNFGATFYWALCGKKLPTLFTVGKKDNSILSDDLIPSPMMINPIVPEILSNFVMECVRTNPAKRPADMAEVIRRLDIIEHKILREIQQGRKFGAA